MSVGLTIGEARMAQGVSISDLAAATKIREALLLSLEANDFECFGGAAYTRGHLKVIAAFLDLDANALAHDFDLQYADPV